MTILAHYSNKEVSFRFNGKDLSFFLSQSLFSSFDIDEGTKFLLKTLIKQQVPVEGSTILDSGCGVGVLGLTLGKSIPDSTVVLQDRDALATYFTEKNAEKNGIRQRVHICTGLAFSDLPFKEYDLIVSNLPAKAGIPVLRHMVKEILFHLSKRGTGALVVVAPLHDTLKEILNTLPAEQLFYEKTKEYSVFHFRKNGAEEPPHDRKEEEEISPYFRNKASYTIQNNTYHIQTVYGLPDFDTPPYETELLASSLLRFIPERDIFMWNPGQGHSPALMLSVPGSKIESITLASRDILQNKIAAYNCRNIKREIPIQTENHPSPLSVFEKEQKGKEKYTGMFFSLSEPGEKKLLPFILPKALESIHQKGFLVLTGKSSLLSAAAKEHHGYIQAFSKKYRGFRILMLQKRG